MNDTQVALIGSGPGGAAIAWSLASAGVKVTLLEAGPRYQPREDYRLHLPDWEQQHFPEKISSRGRQTHAPLQPLEERWDAGRPFWASVTRVYLHPTTGEIFEVVAGAPLRAETASGSPASSAGIRR